MKKYMTMLCVTLLALAGCEKLKAMFADTDALKAQAQQTLNATTQAVTVAQATLNDLDQKIAVEKQVLTTQPSNADALATLTKMQKAEQDAAATIAKGKPIIDGLNAALNTPAGQLPNFGFLGALGPYGDLAALVLTVGFGAYQKVKNVQATSTIVQQGQQIQQTQAALVEVHSDTATSVQPNVPFSAPTAAALVEAGIPVEHIAAATAA